MSDTEQRYGMDEFNTRLSLVENEVKHVKEEVQGFKSEFREHDKEEKSDRKEMIQRQKSTDDKVECIKRNLSELKGFKNGMKAGAAMLLMMFGGVITVALKKLFGL